jgi:hydrogenase large subunit
MAERIVIDPITRIEGHLRVEIEVKDGKITDAYSAGTMVRGIETILKGRDPRDAWAFVGRVCGVCTSIIRLLLYVQWKMHLAYRCPQTLSLYVT